MILFSEYRLGSLVLKNRVVMAPMTRSRALGNVPNATMREYYRQRAAAGLIVTEGIAPSANGLGYARIPGLFSAAQVDGFRQVTQAVHQRGGRIFAQLMHTGRIAHALNLPEGARVVAPSAVQAQGNMYTDAQGPQPHTVPEALTEAGVAATRHEFAQAAKNAIDAGFDGIELHAANGYLLEQFLHPHTNRREDGYGGDVQGRNRFTLEVARACAEAIGKERVGIRLSPYGTFNDLPAHEAVHAQYVQLASELGGLAYVHLIGNPHPAFAATARAMRAAFTGALILNGGFDRDQAERALKGNSADLISFGRPFIANPDLVERMQRDLPLAAPNPATFYTPGAEGYVDYPPAS